MPQLVPLLRERYPRLAKDLLAPLIEVLGAGRAACGGDLDKLLIVLVVGMRTAEHKEVGELSLSLIEAHPLSNVASVSGNGRGVASGVLVSSIESGDQTLRE